MAKQKKGPVVRAKGQKGKDSLLNIRQWLGFAFCAAMLTLFPLFLNPGETYFTITDHKFYFMQVASLLTLGLLLVALIQAALERGRPEMNLKSIWKSVSITQKLVILSTLLWIVSTVFSTFEPSAELLAYGLDLGDSWVGNPNRFNGLRTYLLYALTFFLIVWCGLHHRDWVFMGFAAATIALSIIGILQVWGYNPFSLYLAGVPRDVYHPFYSTIGNTNFLSSMLCICVSFCSGAFVCKENHSRWIYLAAAILGFYFFLLLKVYSGFMGILAFLLLFPLLCWNTPRRLGAGLLLYGCLAVTASIWRMAIPSGPPRFELEVSGGFDASARLCLLVAAVLLALGVLVWLKADKLRWSKKRMLQITALVLLIILIIGVVVFVTVRFPPRTDFLFQAQQVLLRGKLDDSYGSNRMFLWKRTPELVREAPLLGTGPASFLGAFQDHYFKEIFKKKDSPITVYDSTHNMYLDYAVEGGLLGLAAYLAILITLAVRAWRQREHDDMIPILMAAAISYCAQGLFSFMNVTVAPLFWVILGLLELSVRQWENSKV